MLTGWLELLHLKRNKEFVSVDARRVSVSKHGSDPRNYEMLTSPPQQYSMTKDEGGFLKAAPVHHHHHDVDSPIARDFSPSPGEYSATAFSPQSRHERSPSLNFSHPRQLDRSASQSGRVTFSREGPQSPTAWSPISSGANDKARSDSASPAFGYNSPTTLERPRPAQQGPVQTTVTAHERSSSALGKEWSVGPPSVKAPSIKGSVAPNRSNSAMSGRDWDPRSTYARGGGALTPGGTDAASEKGRAQGGGWS